MQFVRGYMHWLQAYCRLTRKEDGIPPEFPESATADYG
jgi:hypothetical protein